MQEGAALAMELDLQLTLLQIFGALLFIIVGFGVGFLIEHWLLIRLQRHSISANQRINVVLMGSLAGMPIFWSTAAGVYAAIIYGEFDADVTDLLLKALQVPVLLSVTLFFMRLSSGLIEVFNIGEGGSIVAASLSRSLTRAIILSFGLLIVLQTVGISITPIIAALGITGLAASLALQETLSNAFSGLYMIFSKQTQPGDYVRLKVDERDHVEGYISDINWRSTRIRMPPQRLTLDDAPGEVNVPNSRMASDIVIISHRPRREQEIRLDITVRAGSDLEQVEAMTLEVAAAVQRETLGRVPEHAPLLRYHAWNATSVLGTVVLYGDMRSDGHLLRHRLLKRLYQRYQQAGVLLTPVDQPGLALFGPPQPEPVAADPDAIPDVDRTGIDSDPMDMERAEG